jgi:cytochrome c peroxidase
MKTYPAFDYRQPAARTRTARAFDACLSSFTYRRTKSFGLFGPVGTSMKASNRICRRYPIWTAIIVCFALLTTSCGSGKAPSFDTGDTDETLPGAPANAQALGERLFLDTRFAQYFAANMTGVNNPLPVGDPVVEQVETTTGTLPGPFAGQSINCRSCHFVTEFQGVSGAGNRTYADFTTRSPIPRQINGFTHTPRNAIEMVGSLQTRSGPVFLHSDGEFNSPANLVKATLTGRNFGWAPDQYNQALAQIALVIRQDDGSGQLAQERSGGLSYSTLLLGTDPSITAAYAIPPSFRLNVQTASDEDILNAVANLISAYMQGLLFKQDSFGRYYASPYDVFLRINHLPTQPIAGETIPQYNQRLLQILSSLNNPIYVDGSYGSFQYHALPFAFGATELAGLKIFLKAATGATDGSQHAGNCAACHQAPNFTDFKFHNTGVSQAEYDAANGNGSFAQLQIPSLAVRNQNYDQYLPASAAHPNASERFRRAAVQGQPQLADLGLWNVYLNPDMPNPQYDLKTVVCAAGNDCSVDQGLPNTIAQFKTPTLRDLADSNPYFHSGGKLTLNDVVSFYVFMSQLARRGQMRNPPLEFQSMSLDQSDVAALVAFLNSLTEDYDDA